MDTGRKYRFLAAAALAAACLLLGFLGGNKARTERFTERVDTLVIRDTVVDYRPIAVERLVVRTDTVRLVEVKRDTVPVRDTVEVEVPVVFSRYRGDNYDVGVSGFRVELEYVKVYPERVTVTRTVSARERRWGFGVAAGPSVVVSPSGRVTGGLGVTGGFYLRL